MNIACISDSHGKHDQIKHLPKADVIVHTGDLSGHGKQWEIQLFMDWFSSLDYKYKIFIAGNHDWFCCDYAKTFKNLVPDNVIYLDNTSYSIEGYMFYGTPWQPVFFNWAFNLEEPELQKEWDKIPLNTDVLLTHCPPHGVLDLALDGRNCGSPSLLTKVLEVNPLAHIFGHIHEANGVINLYDNVTFVNGSVLNRRYIMQNDPIVINIHKNETTN